MSIFFLILAMINALAAGINIAKGQYWHAAWAGGMWLFCAVMSRFYRALSRKASDTNRAGW